MVRVRYLAALILLILTGPTTAPSQDPKPARKDLAPAEIIKAFTANESQLYDIWSQYYYRQIATIKILSIDEIPTDESMTLKFEVVFLDNGTREVKLVERRGRLLSLLWTPEDQDVITNYSPFALTAKDLPSYDLTYEGKEKIDELNTYVFTVNPKSMESGKLHFKGKIWVDDGDLQIVRSVGRVFHQKDVSQFTPQFPEFETIRQIVDKKYWLPVWSHANGVLEYVKPVAQHVRVEETITYEGFKRFTSSVSVKPVKK
jgi:hypothetical protein